MQTPSFAQFGSFQVLSLALSALVSFGCASTQSHANAAETLTVAWPVTNLSRVADYHVRQIGTPAVENDGTGPAVCFSGDEDGIAIPINPLDQQVGFTIQVLFKALPGGSPKQQFLHLQDADGSKVLLEIELGADATFRLHSFVGVLEAKQDLENAAIRHATGEWHWAQLTYNGETVRLYLDGKEEAAGPLTLEPMKSGETALGFRLSEENWFKGCVRELRFANDALPPHKLAQKP